MMSRKQFAIAALGIAVLPILGHFAPAHADALDYLYNVTKAGNDGTPSLACNLRVQQMPGSAPFGSCVTGGINWNATGMPVSMTHYSDALGQHTDVVANVSFSHLSNFVKTDAIQAVATFHMLKKADGSSAENVDVISTDGTTLYATGYDGSGNPIFLPVLSGTLFVTYP